MRITLAVTSVLFAIAACGGDTTSPKNAGSLHALAVAPNDGQADGIVRGIVRGERFVNAADTTSFERVSGASIGVYLEFSHVPVDSNEVAKHQLLGTITSDAQGAFQLTNVPTGYYRLDVTPPSGSPYKPGTSGTVTFTAHSEGTAVVWLYLK